MGDVLEKCFCELLFGGFRSDSGGAVFEGFRWFWGGWVGQSGARSVGQAVGRLVGRSVGQSLGRSVGSPSTPSPSPPPVAKEVLSDIASSVWELCLVWRRLNMG